MAPAPGTTWQGFSGLLQVLLPQGAAATDFPVPPSLVSEPSPDTTTDWLVALAEQRRHRRLLTGRCDRGIQRLEDRTTLLRTRRDYCPDPFAPASAGLPTRPLGDVPVDHHEADRLFRQVVRRPPARRGHDLKVGLPVLL